VTCATKRTRAGQRYLELQREAKRIGRPTDELIQLYALECFLDRLAHSDFAENFVLKGGVLLAALDARRPTRDIDLSANTLKGDAGSVLDVIQRIAAIALDDGLRFDADKASAETIREDDNYSGVRVSLGGVLSRARIRLHVDVNIGDPIWPAPQKVRVPRLLAGELIVRGYPLEMVLAEKIVTAIARGTANTRWRDFVDVYTLVRRHGVNGGTFREALLRVAKFRDVELASLNTVLAGYTEIAQQRWLTWLKKQQLDTMVPKEFSAVLDTVIVFADPVITGKTIAEAWDSVKQRWISAASN
jgi:predicted nucleotidyltransferase component of viral defense system